MAAEKTALLSAEEYRSLPESGSLYQLIQGELRMSPAPGRYHQEISSNIEFLLRTYLERNPLGKLYDAPFDVYLSDRDVYQPDKAFIANERLSILREEGARGAPNLVIEILSPATADTDRRIKKTVYAQAGVEELWLVDPEAQKVEVFRLEQNPAVPVGVYSSGESFSSACFPGLDIPCDVVFRR